MTEHGFDRAARLIKEARSNAEVTLEQAERANHELGRALAGSPDAAGQLGRAAAASSNAADKATEYAQAVLNDPHASEAIRKTFDGTAETVEVDWQAGRLDPSKVKAGDTVTLTVPATAEHPAFTVAGEAYKLGIDLAVGGWSLIDHLFNDGRTLTAHQPAPEPEPEWKPGTVWADEDGKRYLAGTLDGKGPHMYADDGYGIEPDEGLRPLAVVDPAEVNVHHLYEVYVTHAGSGPDGLRVVLAELGIEAP